MVGLDRRGVERDAGRVENDGLRNMQIFVLRALKKSKRITEGLSHLAQSGAGSVFVVVVSRFGE